ncbi:MAG: MtnX-like HAD-IB family phosphatase [Actinomycetota bacterium]
MHPIRSIVVDFDGTACLDDVSEVLLERFGTADWRVWDERVDRGDVGLREAAQAQAALLDTDRETMIDFALDQCRMDPTFRPFVSWAEAHDLPVELASDGFAFYIPPLLQREGLGHLEVITNRLSFDHDGGPAALSHPNAHPECNGCGTCKMLVVQRARREYGPVAFIGEGLSDRYGALYADVVFAKDALVAICRSDGVPFLPYEDFQDVRTVLEEIDGLPGAIEPPMCPGWSTP